MSYENLPPPINTFNLENPIGSYKDFQLKSPDDYPLPGVYFHADYGFIPDYTGEDGHDLDFFVGTDPNGKNGYFTVWRSDEVPEEHKFFTRMSDQELQLTLQEYNPVLVTQSLLSEQDLLNALDPFKNKTD